MITLRQMHQNQAGKLVEIDRSEYIDLIYEVCDGKLKEAFAAHECPTWTEEMRIEIEQRFIYELSHGGFAIGAFDGELLIGFGVLAHKFRGKQRNQLQIDLMYVTRAYRRQGIGKRIFDRLMVEARSRGAQSLYISSTETRSAVMFYQSRGSRLTSEVDEELFRKEPHDVHMTLDL